MKVIADLARTKSLAYELAKNAKPGDCFCLKGNLGAGKTEFARSFIQTLAGDVKVSSPTFNIVQTYPGNISHFDLYRIKSAEELQEIGLEDALSGITLIEWPQIAENILPKGRTEIDIEILQDERRQITICKL